MSSSSFSLVFREMCIIKSLLRFSSCISQQDKTFGIKNKKGKKQQTFIKQVTNQVKYGGGQGAGKVRFGVLGVD